MASTAQWRTLLIYATVACLSGILISQFINSDKGGELWSSARTFIQGYVPQRSGQCGLFLWDSYVLIGDQVVINGSVQPAASELQLCAAFLAVSPPPHTHTRVCGPRYVPPAHP